MKAPIEVIKKPETERVILCEIYSKNGSMGINLTEDANRNEINYFLESYLKVEREEYEDNFRKVE